MPYTDFDRAIMDAWYCAHQHAKGDPEKLKAILRRREMSTYTRPLRSFSLVLRANDSRIDDNSAFGNVRMDRARVRQLCSPVEIPYPGETLDEAARLFGVNRTTVSRWADPEDSGLTWWQDVQGQIEAMRDLRWPPSRYEVIGKRLMLEHYHNVANTKRSVTRVWTPSAHGLDPGGEVWSDELWAPTRAGLADQVDPAFVQQLQRVDRKLGAGQGAQVPSKGPRSRVWQWVCPEADGGCGRLVYKLYLPMPVWTLLRVFGEQDELEPEVSPGAVAPKAFLCQRCAGLIYESAERGSSPGRRNNGKRRRVDDRDRLVKRMSGGVLRGRDVFTDS
ncbi:MAG: hypothetical protein AAF085_00945 [Planctomycetota bacterium]